MKGLRKVLIGLAFIGAGTFISYAGIRSGSDLIGLASVIGAIAAGTFGIVYGNIKEHQADAITAASDSPVSIPASRTPKKERSVLSRLALFNVGTTIRH